MIWALWRSWSSCTNFPTTLLYLPNKFLRNSLNWFKAKHSKNPSCSGKYNTYDPWDLTSFLSVIQNCWYKTISVSGTGTLPPCPSPLFWRKPVWPLTGILNTLAGSWVNCVPLKAPSWSTSGSPICLPNWNLLKLGISRMKSSLPSVSLNNLLVRTLLFSQKQIRTYLMRRFLQLSSNFIS